MKSVKILADYVGETSGAPSRYTSDTIAVVNNLEYVVLMKSNKDSTLSVHEGISESIAPTISNSTISNSIFVSANVPVKISGLIAGKWIIVDVENNESGDATIELFATARRCK